jgi:hypothetical protein
MHDIKRKPTYKALQKVRFPSVAVSFSPLHMAYSQHKKNGAKMTRWKHVSLQVAVCQLWNYAVETDLIKSSNWQYDHKCNSDNRSSSDSSTVWGRQEQPRKSSRRRVQKHQPFFRSPSREQKHTEEVGNSKRSFEETKQPSSPGKTPPALPSLPSYLLPTRRGTRYLP